MSRDQGPAAAVTGQRLRARRQAGAQPYPAGARGQHGGQAPRPGDATAGQHRHRHGLQHGVQQRQRRKSHFPVPAAFRAAGNQHVDAGVNRLTSPERIVNLCDRGDSGVVSLADPRPVGTEADRQQDGPRGQGIVQQPRLVAHHPVHQADSEPAAHLLQLGRQ